MHRTLLIRGILDLLVEHNFVHIALRDRLCCCTLAPEEPCDYLDANISSAQVSVSWRVGRPLRNRQAVTEAATCLSVRRRESVRWPGKRRSYARGHWCWRGRQPPNTCNIITYRVTYVSRQSLLRTTTHAAWDLRRRDPTVGLLFRLSSLK